MPRDAKKVGASLVRKGFLLSEGDHKYYRFFVDGKNTGIRTKISHGEKEIHDKNLGQMAKQTQLAKKEFLDLVDCPLTLEFYIDLLRERGHLPTKSETDPQEGCEAI